MKKYVFVLYVFVSCFHLIVSPILLLLFLLFLCYSWTFFFVSCFRKFFIIVFSFVSLLFVDFCFHIVFQIFFLLLLFLCYSWIFFFLRIVFQIFFYLRCLFIYLNWISPFISAFPDSFFRFLCRFVSQALFFSFFFKISFFRHFKSDFFSLVRIFLIYEQRYIDSQIFYYYYYLQIVFLLFCLFSRQFPPLHSSAILNSIPRTPTQDSSDKLSKSHGLRLFLILIIHR